MLIDVTDDDDTRRIPKGEANMSLWAHLAQSFWEEAETPALRGANAATGAPAFLRAMVRSVVVGSTAMVLTAQVAGIHLAARVDADPSYCVVQSEQCKRACPTGVGNASCVQSCNLQREQCRRDQG